MSVILKAKKAAIAAGTAFLLAGAVVVGTAGSAAAAVPYTFKVCAYGNYTAYGEIPQQGGYSTYLVSPGQCQKITINSGSTYGKVWGLYNTHPNDRFYVGTANFTASKGWSGSAEGTTTSPWLRNFG
ncbi:hypothetical protein PV350_41035 [Streptomyces sp. PA03-6a]|nr:hypothetical protein [Streptomyces sp. PA03-6a]